MTIAIRKAVEPISASPDDDAALMVQAARGNEEAFTLLANRYTGLVFAVAFRMLHNRAAAEDVVQDTMLRLWRSAGRWDQAKGASVKTWLCRIAVNACIDVQRKGGREISGELPERADAAPNAQGMMERDETGDAVKRALKALPARQRSALIMFHYEDMSVADIASVLETSPKGAEGLLRRARQTLRETMEHNGGLRP